MYGLLITSYFIYIFGKFLSAKFPNNIFEKLIDGETFVNVTPISRKDKEDDMEKQQETKHIKLLLALDHKGGWGLY